MMRFVAGLLVVCLCVGLASAGQAMRASTAENAEKSLSTEAKAALQSKSDGTLETGKSITAPTPKKTGTGLLFGGKRQLYTKADKQACESKGGRIVILYNNQTRPTRTVLNVLPKRVTGWTCQVKKP